MNTTATATKNQPRTLHEIAADIRRNWKDIRFNAKPYVDAMSQIFSAEPNAPYLAENAKGVVTGFLANAGTWRGAEAKRIKEELRKQYKIGK